MVREEKVPVHSTVKEVTSEGQQGQKRAEVSDEHGVWGLLKSDVLQKQGKASWRSHGEKIQEQIYLHVGRMARGRLQSCQRRCQALQKAGEHQ